MDGNFADTLAAAESLWKQGDHDGAWLVLEELPSHFATPAIRDQL